MSLYKDRIAQGRCGSCGKEEIDEGESLGPICKEKARIKAAEKRAKIQPGVCGLCGKRPDTGGRRCDECREKQKVSRQKSIALKKSVGVCVASGCHNPVKPGCTLCQPCIDYRSEVSVRRFNERKEEGTCCYCANPPLAGKRICQKHADDQKKYRDEVKMEALIAYGGPVCVGEDCSNSEFEILEIDHIAGGGRKHFRDEGLTGGYSFYRWLKNNNYPPGYRVLCPNCNKKAHRAKARSATTNPGDP